ncbi:IS30 family transposase, partial [Klebsiella pneumoniae]|uniref:IS30 family transposase n=1 Tax=Klebsiella pneumoniae TaxID=573 RepID=UPI00406AB2C9
LKMPAFEWVHVQLHQQKGMISLSPPTICNSAELRKTLTYDRGREMSEHKILEEDLGIDVYFCDPHSPWQKGTCENMNGLIRQYLPKGIDLNQADQHYLNQVAMSLNTRPRKALDWLTPLEKFAQLVDYHMAFETVAPHV